jgi:hypothetical protein
VFTRMLVSLLFVLTVSPLSAQDRNWKNTLKAELEAEYRPTVLARSGITRSRVGTVENPGVVLVIQKAGMLGAGFAGGVTRQSAVRDGTLTRTYQQANDGQYLFKVGDRVYVENVNVHDDAITFRLWTVDPVERVVRGTTTSERYVVQLKFEFDKATLPNSDLSALQDVITAFLMTEEQATAPKTIALGQTPEEVEAILGKPTTVIDLGERKTYVYPTMRVIFVDGKVADVQ